MKKIIQYIKHSIFHKISFWKWKNLQANLIKHGPAFLIIIILMKIIEHIGLTFILYFLWNNIHEFFVLIPVPLIIYLHFITAPVIFFIYIKKLKRKKQKHVS